VWCGDVDPVRDGCTMSEMHLRGQEAAARRIASLASHMCVSRVPAHRPSAPERRACRAAASGARAVRTGTRAHPQSRTRSPGEVRRVPWRRKRVLAHGAAARHPPEGVPAVGKGRGEARRPAL